MSSEGVRSRQRISARKFAGLTLDCFSRDGLTLVCLQVKSQPDLRSGKAKRKEISNCTL